MCLLIRLIFMELAELARLVNAPAKWVLNALAVLEPGARYSDALARRLAVTRAIHLAWGTPLAEAFTVAQRALRTWDGGAQPLTIHANDTDDVGLTLDMYRLMSSFQIRRSLLLSSGTSSVRGRPRTRIDEPLARAQEWGLDLSLIRDNLRKTPAERLRQLDAMEAFRSRARRATRSPSRSIPENV